jgi:hypothetical protein
MFTRKYLVAALILGGCSVPAFATLTTYSSMATFQSATATDTFSNIAFAQGNLGTSTTVGDVTFSTSGTSLNGALNFTGWPTGTTEPSLVSGAGINTLTITLPSDVTAIDFYDGPHDFSLFTIAITDSDGGTYSNGALFQTGSIANPLFFGVTTTGSFTSFTITTQASVDTMTLDDVQTGEGQSQTPEVETLLLVGTGLLGMGYFRRRRVLGLATA